MFFLTPHTKAGNDKIKYIVVCPNECLIGIFHLCYIINRFLFYGNLCGIIKKTMSLISIPQRFQNVFSFFGAKEKSVLGVDIGSTSIKVVQLRKEKERAARGADRRADHSPHWSYRSEDHDASRARAGRRFDPAHRGARQRKRARARDHAHQAHGRGLERVS